MSNPNYQFYGQGENVQVVPVHLVDTNGTPLQFSTSGTFIDNFVKRTDTFTGTGNGTTVDVSTTPMRVFSMSVKATGAIVSWTVKLEGSLDGENFTEILSHTNVIGNNVCLFTGSSMFPCLYFRARCSAISLGLGTNITSTILGVR